MSKGSISKKKKSDALKRHKENEEEEEVSIWNLNGVIQLKE
jgi:hypothetical protein